MFQRCPHLRFALFVVAAVLLARTVVAENLLINSDFLQGKPGDKDFGWQLELAKDPMSKCTVVEGRRPGTRAIRIYNDALGTSFISQKFAVRPWRWYVAEVWVNSEGMYAFDFAPKVELRGGRQVSGGLYHNDAFFGWRKSGWRRIRVIAHSAEAEHLTFRLGGGGHAGGWSGALLFSEPVVRQCSLVEAAGYYPNAHNRHPALYGPALDGAKGQYGYAFQKGNVCRVARNFPNPLYIIGRMNAKAPDGRVSLVLPPGVRFRKVQYKKVTPMISDLPDGKQHVELPPGACEMVVDADLAPGERATGYVYYEWKGGYQLPMPVVFVGVELPSVTAPKRAVAALGVGGWTPSLWENDKAGLASQDAMARDIKRLGFNRVEPWGGSGKPYAERGLQGASAFGGTFYVDVKKHPESLAIKLDGKPCMDRRGLMCPSYRGPALEAHTKRVRGYAAHASALTLDDEFYASSGESPIICFDDRCMKRWSQWVTKNHPDLEEISPKVFCQRPHKHPEHYEAWLRFRCDLVAERYGLLRQAFHEAVEKSGVKTTPRRMLGAYIGGGPLVGMHSNKSLSPVLDYLANMVYEDGDGVRKEVARLAPRSGGKLVVALSPGYLMSPPGDARSQVLEAVMGGSQGFIAWGYYMGMTTGHLVDMAEAIKMFAPVEDVILDGAVEEGYGSDKDSVNLLARRKGDLGVLLVSDYSPSPGRVMVSVPGEAKLAVADLFTDKIIARLDSQQRAFAVELKRSFRARLYRLQPQAIHGPAKGVKMTPKPDYRVIFNYDSGPIFEGGGPPTPQDVEQMVDEIAAGGADVLLICTGSQRTVYPSKVWQTHWEGFKEGDRSFFGDIPKAQIPRRATWIGNMARFAEQNDYLAIALARCRQRGIAPGVTVRMNDMHDAPWPSSHLFSRFYKENPQLHLKPLDGRSWGAEGLDYAHQEVREHYLSLVRELAERYDLDVLELDFMRFPYYFDRDNIDQHCDTMTGFVREVRQVLDGTGRHIVLIPRVASSPDAARQLGFDVQAWAREGLVDGITTANFLTTCWDLAVEDFRELVGPRIAVYASVEVAADRRDGLPVRYLPGSYEMLRGVAAGYLAAGADGINTFNFFLARRHKPVKTAKEFYGGLREMRSLEHARSKPRIHLLTAGFWLPECDRPEQVPVLIRSWRERRFQMLLTAEGKGAEVTVLVYLDGENGAEDMWLRIGPRSSGHAVEIRKPPEGEKDDKSIRKSKVAVFKVPPNVIRDGRNELIIRTGKVSTTILGIDVQVGQPNKQ